MSKESRLSAAEILDRLKLILKLRTDKEVAALLGVPNSTLNGWRIRNASSNLLGKIGEKQLSLSIDKLISGDINASAPGSTAIGHVIHSETSNSELDKLLKAALSLGSEAEVKKLLQDFISQKIKES